MNTAIIILLLIGAAALALLCWEVRAMIRESREMTDEEMHTEKRNQTASHWLGKEDKQ